MAAEKTKLGGGGDEGSKKEQITVFVGKQGAPIATVPIDRGTKLKDVVETHGLAGREVRLNGKPASMDTELEDQQTIVAVPPAVSGGRK